MRKKDNYPIDFVVLWVDGSDKKWLEKKKKYQPELVIADAAARYRDWGIFKYWFRAVEKYAPWVNHIYLVTDNQTPEWLNQNNPKISVIDHKEIMDKEYLPTFNSQAIEMNLHKIPGLSEHFVYFNDDMFLSGPVKKEHFFKNGVPVEIANINAATGMEGDQLYARTMFNDILLINRHFSKRNVLRHNLRKWVNLKYGSYNIRTISQLMYPYFTGYKSHHGPTPFIKSTFFELWGIEEDEIRSTCSHRFRHKDDLNQYIFTLWQICKGGFYPRKKGFGRLLKLKDDNIETICSEIKKEKVGFLCINDSVVLEESDVEKHRTIKIKLCRAFKNKLNAKSSFER